MDRRCPSVQYFGLVRLGYRRLDFIMGSHATFAKLLDEEKA
jgi:hypothetical protein